MNKVLYLVAGITAATAYFLVRGARSSAPAPVEELAHKLQDAWADHHTVV